MSENAEEKAKRDLVWKLLVYPWAYQTTIFFSTADCGPDLLEEMPEIRTKIRRAFPKDVFFLRIGLKHHGKPLNETTSFETIYSLRPLPELKPLIREWMGEAIYVKRRRIGNEKRFSSARSIKRGKLHDLNAHFGKEKVNRIRFLNAACLPAPDRRLYDALLKGSSCPSLDDLR